MTIDIVKPDIIIDFFNNKESDLPVIIIYVRPESNEVHYEKALILGTSPFADITYLANLNGKIFLKNALILEHYAIQYKFAIYAEKEMVKYPEMVKKFEQHFKIKIEKAKIIGSFDAMIQLGISADEMFDTIVDSKDFLSFYGQTVKKIRGFYVFNYNMPAIIKKYTPDINVFVLAARLKSDDCSLTEINHSIFDQIKKDSKTQIIDESILKEMEWNEKIKRTYHISRNHIMATFDMMDFIFRPNGDRIQFDETPIGRILIEQYNIKEDTLHELKENPIVYIKEKNKRKKRLINIIEEAKDKSMNQCIEMIKSVLEC